MGPAFFPFWLGVMLLALGCIIAVAGLKPGATEEDRQFPVFHWKPNFWVLGAIVLFGMILKPVGMLIAGVLLIVIAGLGSDQFKPKRSIILGVVLSVTCAMVFAWGLKLPIPLCPDIEALQSSIGFCRG
jgi:hypothetical protein